MKIDEVCDIFSLGAGRGGPQIAVQCARLAVSLDRIGAITADPAFGGPG